MSTINDDLNKLKAIRLITITASNEDIEYYLEHGPVPPTSPTPPESGIDFSNFKQISAQVLGFAVFNNIAPVA